MHTHKKLTLRIEFFNEIFSIPILTQYFCMAMENE